MIKTVPAQKQTVRAGGQLRPRAANRRTDTRYQTARASSMARVTRLRGSLCHPVNSVWTETAGEMTSASNTVPSPSVQRGNGPAGHPADGLQSFGDGPGAAAGMGQVLEALGIEHVLEAPLELPTSEVRCRPGDEALVHLLVEHDEAVGMVDVVGVGLP